ncbi:hypothetical protein NDU88_005841 [Pleurodeles waltl]|uniref:Uncharacterized protein n=1 Tax=Pleurodeles waltl TaxID=8319 RepID=A0AAV7X0Q2_PLEWA|nr:hypothetical protein NDU88_005841 [Pleurodeles waltl]
MTAARPRPQQTPAVTEQQQPGLHAPEVPEVESFEGGKDHPASLKYKEIHIPLGENTQPGFAEKETYDALQASQGKVTSPSAGEAGNSSHTAKTSEAGVEVTVTKKKVPDWPKDGADKFYSLTDDSDSTNSDQSSSDTGASISSESGSFSSLAESTVRRRESKGLKVRDPMRDGVELSAQSRKTLKMDYSGTNLISTAEAHIPEAQAKAEKSADAPVCSSGISTGTRNTDSEMLQSIYDSIKELQTEKRAESRRARMATKHLQGTVRKVVKSCIEIEEKLSTMEERTVAVEADVVALREQTTAHDGQLIDIMWKLEDQENRQMRNNLRFLGIGEGVEGIDIRAYMIKMLQDAFPEVSPELIQLVSLIRAQSQ